MYSFVSLINNTMIFSNFYLAKICNQEFQIITEGTVISFHIQLLLIGYYLSSLMMQVLIYLQMSSWLCLLTTARHENQFDEKLEGHILYFRLIIFILFCLPFLQKNLNGTSTWQWGLMTEIAIWIICHICK